MLEGFITEMPIVGWALMYLTIGWIYAVIDIIRNYVKEEEEIAARMVVWPLFILAKLLMWFFGVCGKGMRATERLGTKIRDFDNEMRKP